MNRLLVTVLAAGALTGVVAAPASSTNGGSAPGTSPTQPAPTTGTPVAKPPPSRLTRALRHLMRRASRHSGAYVYDITARQPLFSYRSRTRRILASNTKLFTTSAALAMLGVNSRFVTDVLGDGSLAADGTYNGNLYLRGSGDPMFGSRAFIRHYYGSGASVEDLASAIVARGIDRVTGNIYGDDTLFDQRRGTVASGFGQSSEIGGALSALAFNRGPSARTSAARYAARKFRRALRTAHVRVDGSVHRRATPAGASTLAADRSLPLSEIVAFTNKPSDNYLAEMLMKQLGDKSPPASTADGVIVAKRFARGLGSRVSLADGSGLSRSDRAAPHEVVDLLVGIRGLPIADVLTASLPVPGVDGTLARRMRGHRLTRRCAAKTGSLSNVSTLSGYCTNRAGHVLAFSLLMNYTGVAYAHTVQDRIVERLAASR